MKKRITIFLLSLAVILSACARGSQTTPSPESTIKGATAQPGEQSARQPGCTVKTKQATPNPTLQTMLPDVTAKDWAQGSPDAFVTIIEYSDFQ